MDIFCCESNNINILDLCFQEKESIYMKNYEHSLKEALSITLNNILQVLSTNAADSGNRFFWKEDEIGSNCYTNFSHLQYIINRSLVFNNDATMIERAANPPEMTNNIASAATK